MSTSKNRYQANFSVAIDTDDPVEATQRLAELTYAIRRLEYPWLRSGDINVNFGLTWLGGLPPMPNQKEEADGDR